MTQPLTPGPEPANLIPDEKAQKARKHGRMGLAPAWEQIPWWGVIILIVGIIAGYSALTNSYYQDAIYFIFDLPWNKDVVTKIREGAIEEDGTWSYTFARPKEGSTYTFYAQYLGEGDEDLGRSVVYRVEIPNDAEPVATDPLEPVPEGEVTIIDTSTPTMVGIAPAGTQEIRIIDDFSNQIARVANRIWLANGFILTIKVTLMAFVLALILGLLFGLMRVSNGSPNLREGALKRLAIGLGIVAIILLLKPDWRTPITAIGLLIFTESVMFLMPALPYTISTLYVEIVRGVPMLVIILYMGFAVTPALRSATNGAIDLRGVAAGVIGLGFGYGAYLAEVFRAGIEAIPDGQMEAARSIGMSYFQAMRFVILPQAVRLILPPLGNDLIALLKDSSLISVIALPEILQQGRLWVSRNFRAFEGFNSVMLMYLVLTLTLSLFVRAVERRAELPGD